MGKSDLPIGVFDSGVGGLTVAKAILDLLPAENIIYLGDTARVPYGTREKETITKFALEMVSFLLKENVKALVVACNTISSNSLPEITAAATVPVIDVVSPAVSGARELTKNKKIGVIGTRATINSKIYEKELTALDPEITVISQACPLFIPLVEEGFADNPATALIAESYLGPVRQGNVDTLILGCTHFPIIQATIAKTVGEGITLVNSGRLTAEKLKNVLSQSGLLKTESSGNNRFCFTDDILKAEKVGSQFFGGELPGQVEKVSL